MKETCIRNSLISLLKVKTLITLPIVGILCYLAVVGKITPTDFMSIATVIIMFYFTKKDDTK